MQVLVGLEFTLRIYVYHENGIPHMWIKAGSSQKTGCGRKPSGREETVLFEAVHWGMGNRLRNSLTERKLGCVKLSIEVNGESAARMT